MSKEIGEEAHGRKGTPKSEVKKIHPSHFQVGVKVHLEDKGYNAKYEWVDSGKGRWKLVRIKSQVR